MLIVDMPMPIVCADCPICICLNGRKPAYCKAVLVDDDNIVDGTMWKETDPNSIPNWCPIKGEIKTIKTVEDAMKYQLPNKIEFPQNYKLDVVCDERRKDVEKCLLSRQT